MGNISKVSSKKNLTAESVALSAQAINVSKFGGYFVISHDDDRVSFSVGETTFWEFWVWERRIECKSPRPNHVWVYYAWDVFMNELAKLWSGRLSCEGENGTRAPRDFRFVQHVIATNPWIGENLGPTISGVPEELKPWLLGDNEISEIDTRHKILYHMSKAFFGCAWAEYSERVGPHYKAGSEILDVMPGEVDPAAVHAAECLVSSMEEQYHAPITELIVRARNAPAKYSDRPCTPEFFGHYAAMHAMGTGVGLECVCDRSAFPDFPYMEFSMYDLDSERYPIPEDLE